MNYFQKKKLAFMSIVNSVKGFVRTITGALPLTLEGCVDEESIIDYTLYGQSVQNGAPAPEAPVEVESVGEKTRNLITATDGYIVKHAENRYIKYDAKTQVFTIHGSGMLNYVYLPETIPSGTTTSIFVEIVNDDYEFVKGGLGIGGYGIVSSWQNNLGFTATSQKKQSGVRTITEDTDKICIFVDANASVKNVQVRITYAVCDTEFTEYEPYGYKIPITASSNGKTVTTNIYLDEPLRKVGDYADYIDFENGKVVRNVEKYTFTGKETDQGGATNDPDSFGYVVKLSSLSLSNKKAGLCNCLRQGVVDRSGTNRFAYHNIANHPFVYVFFKKTDFPELGTYSPSTAKQVVKEMYDSGVPMVLYYNRNTPTETSITLPNLPTFKGTSIISADTTIQPSNAEITYYSNVKE